MIDCRACGEYTHLRSLGDARYQRLVSAKVRAADHFEQMGKYCKAFLVWAELARNSAGIFDAAAGVRRSARRVRGRPSSTREHFWTRSGLSGQNARDAQTPTSMSPGSPSSRRVLVR